MVHWKFGKELSELIALGLEVGSDLTDSRFKGSKMWSIFESAILVQEEELANVVFVCEVALRRWQGKGSFESGAQFRLVSGILVRVVEAACDGQR